MPYDSRPDTIEHVRLVRAGLARVAADLAARGEAHDASKLESPEVEMFDLLTPRLRDLKFGTPEYVACRAELGDALAHHYAHNDHHPEFYGVDACRQCGRRQSVDPCTCGGPLRAGLDRMALPALIEMLVDWRAAALRHADGDIRRSIEINQATFGYSDDIKQILLNTVPLLDNLA